jgi:putative ABC transport system permease protein
MFAAWAPVDLPRADEVTMDLPVLLFAMVLSILTATLFGLVPAWRLTKADPQDALRSGGRGQSESGSKIHLREVLVGIEAGLSVALLIVAGLLSASFLRIGAVDPGFVSQNVLTAEISLPAARYKDDDAKRHFYSDLVNRLQSQPGVIAAGAISVLPFGGSKWSDLVSAEGDTRPVAARPIVEYRPVSPNYFRAMGIPLEQGRSVEDSDYPHKPALLSKMAAAKIWPGQNPIGKRFRRFDPNRDPYEVVGIVGDVRNAGLENDPVPLIYVPLWEMTPSTIALAVRTTGEPVAAVGALRDAVRSVDAQVPLSAVRTMVQIEKGSLAQRSFEMLVAGVFAAGALLLALIGTYSVLAYSVSARTNEIGIRMALGAVQPRVIGMILLDGLRPVIAGVAAGAVIALLLGRFLKTLLYSISPADPLVFMLVILSTLTAGTLACIIPARRAASVSPMEALRHE